MSCLLPRRFGFDYSPIPVEFVVDRVAVGQVSLLILRFSSVGVISQVVPVLFITVLVTSYNLSNLRRR
jgi:hypothetical protein